MRRLTFVVIGLSTALASSAFADKPPKPDKVVNKANATKPAKMSCEDFLALEEVARPKLVYWAEGFNRKGEAEDAVFDVATTDRLVPVLVEVCKKEPRESFLMKVRHELK